MFTYKKTEASIALPAGEYAASLASVEETTSKKGNPMLEVVWKVYPSNGSEKTVWDYIVRPATIWKLKLIAKAMDKLAEFESETFDLSQHIGRNITLTLRVKDDPAYGEKNEVDGYSPSGLGGRKLPAGVAAPAATREDSIKDEDIPF